MLFRIVFYGHIWIALAAAALTWQFLSGSEYSPGYGYIPYALSGCAFCATLSVYTLHRLLSFRRVSSRSEYKRYQLVADYPGPSLLVSILSAIAAGWLFWLYPYALFFYAPLIPVAFFFTIFYLVPFWPGGPRLRDVPYLKFVWVGIAWGLVTIIIPIIPPEVFTYAFGMRFCFTAAVAVLFDFRDVQIDRKQGVKTLAADYPLFARALAVILLIFSSCLSYQYGNQYRFFEAGWSTVSYLACIPMVFLVGNYRSDENFFAVWVNGLLFLPPLFLLMGDLIDP